MSILYFPDTIQHKFFNFYGVPQNTRLKTEMDFGTHSRNKGTRYKETLYFDLDLTREEFQIFKTFIDIVGAGYFYMKHPDVDNPDIDTNKYYYFSFENEEDFERYNKNGSYGYEIKGFALAWHFMFPGIDKV